MEDVAASATVADVEEGVEATAAVVDEEVEEPHEEDPGAEPVVVHEAAPRSLSSSTDTPVFSSPAARRTYW